MLGTKNGAAGVVALKKLAAAGIILNCQIVCCPGINDGAELDRTIKDLYALGTGINSVSVVPVGLTGHREGLTALRPFDRELALQTVRQVDRFGERCMKRRGSRVFFCADELYIKAGLKLPPHTFYEEYPQLENGVGMMRLFITEFEREFNAFRIPHSEFSIATGNAAYKYLTKLLKTVSDKCGKMDGKVYAIRNEFFGGCVTVSGLITGGDIINQLKGRKLGSRLLIPQNMLRHGDEVFLDDITVAEVSETLGVPIRIVKQNGADFFRALIES
jgi:putative radical SAM enzyme (TIGR03279 family)